MLENLNDLIDKKPKYFGPLCWGLNRDEAAMQIAKIRASLPQEVKQAATVTRESERIVESAREDANLTLEKALREGERLLQEARTEAERLLEQARIEQQRLVADSEVLKIAKAQAEEVRNDATRDALQMRRGAEDYAHDLLTQLEGVIGKIMATVENGKQTIRPSQGNAVVAARDRTAAR
jgi:cell division septum initiation protein DivIVA